MLESVPECPFILLEWFFVLSQKRGLSKGQRPLKVESVPDFFLPSISVILLLILILLIRISHGSASAITHSSTTTRRFFTRTGCLSPPPLPFLPLLPLSSLSSSILFAASSFPPRLLWSFLSLLLWTALSLEPQCATRVEATRGAKTHSQAI